MPKEMSKTELLAMAVLLSLLLGIWSAPYFGYRFMGVIGTSMNPVITEDDIVVIKTDYQELKLGDIICYQRQIENEEFLFMHRIIEIYQDGWIQTKGDNMSELDPYLVKPSQVIGKEILVIPKLGIPMRAIHTFYGFLLLIVVPAALLICLEIKKIFSP